MKVLVIIGHQNQGSFCHAITETAIEQLKTDGHEVIYHDLYAEGFDPILHHDEITSDENLPPEIRRHCEEIIDVDGYVVVHPNWWGQPPALLKGYIDRVFRQGIVYRFGEGGVIGHLGEKKALVITTSNTPRDIEIKVFSDPLENLWKNCIFGFCGVTDFKRRNFESIVLSSQAERVTWLEETRQLVKEQFKPCC